MMAGLSPKLLLLPGLLMALSAASPPAPITIDYPPEGSIFPPEITPPTWLWRDAGKSVTFWRIEFSFGDGGPEIQTTSRGERPRIGRIDPDCVADTNQAPALTPELSAAHSWTPDRATWQAIKRRSAATTATVTITGFRGENPDTAVSRGRVAIRTSTDRVGAPIFYRDVPLMPSELEKGVIKPLAAEAVLLVSWRIRNVGDERSRVVMDNLPLCANCHSFSADGKTMGMDLDGLQNNRGMYILATVARETAIRKQDVIQWSSPAGKLKGNVRIGFMSQVSPDGQFVATTVNPAAMAGGPAEPPSNYYVANFRDYRFLQVFYPTRGILSWYSRRTGVLLPLPGADDPRFVQMGAVWSPDGKCLVFARASATDPDRPGAPPAQFANDPNELQLQYDLYRIPFRDGRGGVPEPIAGASRNGTSNTFPKVSPDGRWIVFVKCRNGQLMRPDSQLYIVPAAGGTARRMRCNTARMNSWHSFSPNGRWMVFSSKSRSPYTQMYLTHIDREGNDSPPILIENATAANRAVNIPEFVNIAPDGLRRVGGPVIDYYRLVNNAAYLQKKRAYEASAAQWRKVLELNADDEAAHRNLAAVLLMTGRREEAAVHLRREAIRLHPDDATALQRAAWVLATSPDASIRDGGEALALALRAVDLSGGGDAGMLDTLAAAYAEQGRFAEAVSTARRALARATQENLRALEDGISMRVALYEAHRPFRERDLADSRR